MRRPWIARVSVATDSEQVAARVGVKTMFDPSRPLRTLRHARDRIVVDSRVLSMDDVLVDHERLPERCLLTRVEP